MAKETNGSILIVDDNPSNLRTLIDYLEQCGFETSVATGGERALRQLELFQPDLILLDILMPDMNGFDTCRHLKSNEKTRDIPVIFMTALSDTISKVAGFEAGGVDYVAKPFQYEELLARINAHLTIRTLQKEMQKQNVRFRELAEAAFQQRDRESMILNRMSEIFHTCHAQEETYAGVREICQEIFPSDSGGLYMLDPSQTVLHLVASWGDLPVDQEEFPIDPSRPLCHDSAHVIEDPKTGMLCASLNFRPDTTSLCVPVSTPNQLFGLLHLWLPSSPAGESGESGKDRLDSKHKVLTRVTELYALFLENLQLHERLKTEAIRDPVTNLYNRRYTEESLEREIHHAERHNTPIGLIMIDIDRVDSIQSTHGDEARDTVLLELGTLLRRHTRAGDIVCRYSAETFLVVLPEAPLEIVHQRAEELRTIVSDLLQIRHQEIVLTITLSMGVAAFPQHGRNLATLVKHVGAALQQAKTNGRNQVVVARCD
jgi:diguanylate cyclase (GGDEF)-like protein